MKFADTKLKKTIIVVVSLIITFVVVVIVLISPITKYLIEKYDVEVTGRQITMDWVYVNPFSGYLHFKNLKIQAGAGMPAANKGDSLFFTASGLSINFAMFKLLSKTIEISEITIDEPRGNVVQDNKLFNFSDLIQKFTPVKPTKPSAKTPSKIHFNILKITIKGGEFHYFENLIPVRYFIKNVIIESTGKQWNSDTIAVRFSLSQGVGTGDLKGVFTINFKTNDYRVAVVARKFDLQIIKQYLKELTNNANFSANLDADIKARGNFKDEENVTMSGQIAVNDFHFGKSQGDDLASFEKLVLAIKEVSPRDHKYLFDSVSVIHPFLKYERYDYLDNLQRMIGKNGSNITAVTSNPAKFNLVIEIARYVKVLAKNFFQSYYRINRLAIYNGDVKYNDYAISERFSVSLDPLFFIADSIDKNHKRVYANFKSGIKPYGAANISLSINPKDSVDFDIQYHVQNVPVSMFNPYLITYTSFPLDRGTLEVKGTWRVRDGIIQSDNHLVIIDPRRTGRIRNKDKKWLPLPLIMSLVRERGNVIDYQIPITGNLKDPKFHLHDVIVDLLDNTFIKPASAPYRMEVKNLEAEIEQSITLKWQMRQTTLLSEQQKFTGKMVKFLEDNPTAKIQVYPIAYTEKEKEYILFFEAKKRYFMMRHKKNTRTFTAADSVLVDVMSAKDSLFIRYLDAQVNDTMLYTVQEKCVNYIGTAIVDAGFRHLIKERENAFMLPFKEHGVEARVKMHATENNIPYNGFSFYKISYNGELPESLKGAYAKLQDLNDEAPRKKYKKEHKLTEKNRKK